MKSIFIITSSIRTSHQTYLLQECVGAIKQHNPESDIVVIHDCSTQSLIPELKDVKIEYTTEGYLQCGELNAYVWACKHYEEYDRFIFLHDSTKILQPIPVYLPEEILFRPIWYSSNCIDTDTRGDEINIIKSRFTLDISEPYEKIQKGGYYGTGGGNMVFGGMGIFTKEFVRRLGTETNFIEIAKLFNRRSLRCFFERFLYCIIYKYQDTTNYRHQSLCGCIFNHGNPFKNRTPEGHAARNPYVVKCWQER
jgi:hypothetical protein